MCTASWHRTPDQTVVYFNRDEQRSRSEGRPPTLERTPEGIRYLAPTDPDAGGTWIGVNEFGLFACILNAYDIRSSTTSPTQTRGELVRRVMKCTSAASVEHQIGKALSEAYFDPFTLLWMDSSSKAQALRQHDGTLEDFPLPLSMLTTSSFESQEVHAWRSEAFAQQVRGPEDLPLFHHLACAESPAYGVLMDREDARTVSQTNVRMTSESLSMHYRSLPDGEWSGIAIPARPK